MPLRPCVQGLLLRRTKATRIDGQPVVDLPERRVVLRRIPFSPPERSYYDDLQKESASQLRVRAEAPNIQAASVCFHASCASANASPCCPR